MNLKIILLGTVAIAVALTTLFINSTRSHGVLEQSSPFDAPTVTDADRISKSCRMSSIFDKSDRNQGSVTHEPPPGEPGCMQVTWSDGSADWGEMVDGLQIGVWCYTDPSGIIRQERAFRNGTLDGIVRWYDEAGLPECVGYYRYNAIENRSEPQWHSVLK
jgi:hypothetical protein